ncbi:MAG: NmrA family NAD(P)-binding protein [Promethearchaeota archaeon]
MEEKILITAAAGNVGSEIVKELKRNKIPFKAADIRDVREVLGNDITYLYYNLENPETYKDVYKNVKKMFLNRPPHMTEFKDSIFPAIDAAKEAGIEHIVFLSMIGVNKRVPHYKIEKYLLKSGINYTFLRASFFMQNLINVHGEIIRKEKDLFIPAGKGKISFVDIRDIAAVAVRVFRDTLGTFLNKTLNLSGCEALDFYKISDLMTKQLGEKITYSNPKSKAFVNKMLTYGFPKDFVKVMKMIYFIVRLGKADQLYPDVEEILGREPINMKQFIKDHADKWL